MKISLNEYLSNQFKAYKKSQKDSLLNIYTSENNSWSIYFRLGRIIWATGGNHRFRKWHRLMNQYCPNINLKAIQVEQIDDFLCEYYALKKMLSKGELELEKANCIIRDIITEVLFEILQFEPKISQISLEDFEEKQNEKIKEAIIYINPELALKKSQDLWESWCNAGLANISPNIALLLAKPEQLKSSTNSVTYQKISILVDGNKTLRDLALITKQELVNIALSFFPYVQNNIISLQEIPDLANPIGLIKPNKSQSNQRQSTAGSNITKQAVQRLILCVDDNPKICHTMKEILTASGYKFIDVQDPLDVLPTLIEHKPDLVFLDLVMPVANGYEICSQIRKMSNFKDLPIVILTGNDGIVDRVRAKMVGASEFLAKPIESKKVLAVANRFLNSTVEDFESNYTLIEIPSL